MPEPEARILPLDQLHEYPLQPLLAGTVNQQDDTNLQDSLQQGQREPVHALPPGNAAGLPGYVVIDGHRRWRALLAIGETVAKVLVRHDLANSTREEVDELFYRSSFDRRQLDPISKAFIAASIVANEKGVSLDELFAFSWQSDELRDRIGKMLGLSGRHLGRLLRVIRASNTIQNAVRGKQLPIVMAAKVIDLSSEQQAEIDERIRNGETARKVVAEFVGEPGQRAASSETIFNRYVRALSVALEAMEDSLEKVCFSPRKNDLDLLGRASELNGALKRRLAENQVRNAREEAEADRELEELLADL